MWYFLKSNHFMVFYSPPLPIILFHAIFILNIAMAVSSTSGLLNSECMIMEIFQLCQKKIPPNLDLCLALSAGTQCGSYGANGST